MCAGYADIFRPEVAKATIDCLKISPSCEEGDPDINDCPYAAVEEACPVADVVTFCDTLVDTTAGCAAGDDTDTLKAACVSFVPALSQSGKTRLQACAADEEACALSLPFCMNPGYASTALSRF